MSTYATYRPSNIPFLKEVPSHWRVWPFRRIFSESHEVNGSHPVGEMLSISGYRGVETKHYDSEIRRRPPEEVESYRVVRPGQLAVNTMWMNYSGLGVSTLLGHVSPAYRAYNISSVLLPRYAHYLLRSDLWVSGYTAFLTGVRPNSLQMSREDLMKFPVLVPPAGEQQQIADYLDRETAEIDALTEDLTRLLDGIQERFAATRDPLVTPAGDSPQTQLRHALIGLRDGSHGTHSRVGPEGVPLLSAKNVSSGKLLLTASESRISETEALELTKSGFPRERDVLLTVVGTIGRTAIYPPGPVYPFQRSVAFLRPNPKLLLPGFLVQLIRSQFFQDQLNTRSKTSAQPGVYLGDVGSCLVYLPSISEQERIARALEKAEKQILETSDQINHAITLARERRAALITAAVTGQIDVTARHKPAAEQLEDDIAQGLHREN